MRSVSAPLAAFFASSTDAIVVDLVTLTLAASTVYRWTSHSRDITTGGNTFTAGGTGTAPLVGRGRIRDTVGLDPSDLTLRLTCGSTSELGGVKLQLAAVNGVLDGARVQLERAYLTTAEAVIGTMLRFEGQVSTVSCASNSVELVVSSDLEALNQVLPRHVYGPLCTHAVFDAGCGVVRASYTVTGSTAAGSTTSVVQHSLGSATDYYAGGAITITSGTLTGVVRNILASTGSAFTVDIPFPSAPATGVTFSVYPGCDKSITTCNTKFINLPRRRGFDWVPTPEAVNP